MPVITNDDPLQGPIYITDNPLYIGTTNPFDPFTLYPDFPNTQVVLMNGRKSSYNPATGGTTVKTYSGTLDDLTTISDWAAGYFFSYELNEKPNRLGELTITIPYDEITYEDNKAPEENFWEIIPNSVARSIFDAGIFFTQPNGQLSQYRYTVPPIIQTAIVKAVKENGSLNLTSNDPNYGQYANIATQFYNILRADVNSIQSDTVTVRRTATYSVNDPNALDNIPTLPTTNDPAVINPIISSNTLTNLFQVTTAVVDQLPESYSRYKTDVNATPPDSISMFVLGGYLVGKPTRTFLTPTRQQIAQTFIFDEWLQNCYSLASPLSDFPLIGNTPYPQNGNNN